MSSIEGRSKTGSEGSGALVPDEISPNTGVDTNQDDDSYDNPGKVQQRIEKSGGVSSERDLYENPGKHSK